MIPLKTKESWNTIEINLNEILSQIHKTQMREFKGFKIYTGCKIRKIFLSNEKINAEIIDLFRVHKFEYME